MIYADVGEGVAFLIREESKRIRRFGQGPRVEIRASLMVEAGIALIPILISVGVDNCREVYETWLNVHQTGGGLRYLKSLAMQDQIHVLFYGDKGRERAIGVPNRMRDSFAQMVTLVRGMPPWSMMAFGAARETVYERHPTVQHLWGELQA